VTGSAFLGVVSTTMSELQGVTDGPFLPVMRDLWIDWIEVTALALIGGWFLGLPMATETEGMLVRTRPECIRLWNESIRPSLGIGIGLRLIQMTDLAVIESLLVVGGRRGIDE